ncbi:hypothetical protein MY1884_001477 [Beauveria asiatica]
MSTNTPKLPLSRLNAWTANGVDLAFNPLNCWAICSPGASAPDPVIVVIRPEKSREFSWVDVALSKLENEHMGCGFKPCNGQTRGSLAVKVGTLFIDPRAEGTKTLLRDHWQFSGKGTIFVWEPRNRGLWGAVQVTVVKMVNSGDHQLYALARQRHSMAPRELKPLPLEDEYLPWIAFYSHFVSMPLAPTVNERLQQIRDNIANFCKVYVKTHFGDDDKGDNGGALKPFVVTKGLKRAAIHDAALVDVCKTCGSTSGAGETSDRDEAKQVREDLPAYQGAVRQARHADAATNTEDWSLTETLGTVLAILYCLCYGLSGCLRALLTLLREAGRQRLGRVARERAIHCLAFPLFTPMPRVSKLAAVMLITAPTNGADTAGQQFAASSRVEPPATQCIMMGPREDLM